MERPVPQPPHRGRIVGEGLGCRPSLYFPESKEDRAKRKQQEDTDVKTQLAKMLEIINYAVTKIVMALLPHLLTATWNGLTEAKSGLARWPALPRVARSTSRTWSRRTDESWSLRWRPPTLVLVLGMMIRCPALRLIAAPPSLARPFMAL
jgi:hypothetical protein